MANDDDTRRSDADVVVIYRLNNLRYSTPLFELLAQFLLLCCVGHEDPLWKQIRNNGLADSVNTFLHRTLYDPRKLTSSYQYQKKIAIFFVCIITLSVRAL